MLFRGISRLVLFTLSGYRSFTVVSTIGGFINFSSLRAARPDRAYVTQHCRVDDQSAEWIDKMHIQLCDAAHRLNVDGPIQAITRSTRQESKDREPVDGGVPDLGDRFTRRDEENPKCSLASARRNERRLLIGVGEPVQKAFLECLARLAVPVKHPAEQGTEPEEELGGGARSVDAMLRQKGPNINNGTVSSVFRKIDCPHVVYWNSCEQ